MDFIDNKVPEGVRRVLSPQGPVVLPDQQVVEHLVVGHQDVRRGFLHLLSTSDHSVFGHLLRLVAFASHIQADPHLPEAGGIVVNQFRKTPGLVTGQRVHRIKQDRLDAALRWIR